MVHEARHGGTVGPVGTRKGPVRSGLLGSTDGSKNMVNICKNIGV